MGDNQFDSSEAEASKTIVHKDRDVDDYVCIKNYPSKGLYGISILEVFSVTYLGSSPVEPKDQIGSICLETNNTLYYLYYETKMDTSKPSIKYGDQLCVENVGPICSFTELELKFDLFSGKYKGSREVVAHLPEYGNWLAKPSMKSIDGYMRDISVLFGCFPNATVANLQVVLPHIAYDATSNVYGVIMATNSKFDHPSCISYLFSHNPASTVEVGHNGVIPLSKSRVGVPLDSQLYVDISLFCDGCHYKGTAYLTPEISNKNSAIVDDEILVKVTWNCNEDSNFTDEDSNFTDEDSNCTDEDTNFTYDYDSASEYEYDSEDETEKEIFETVP